MSCLFKLVRTKPITAVVDAAGEHHSNNVLAHTREAQGASVWLADRTDGHRPLCQICGSFGGAKLRMEFVISGLIKRFQLFSVYFVGFSAFLTAHDGREVIKERASQNTTSVQTIQKTTLFAITDVVISSRVFLITFRLKCSYQPVSAQAGTGREILEFISVFHKLFIW